MVAAGEVAAGHCLPNEFLPGTPPRTGGWRSGSEGGWVAFLIEFGRDKLRDILCRSVVSDISPIPLVFPSQLPLLPKGVRTAAREGNAASVFAR